MSRKREKVQGNDVQDLRNKHESDLSRKERRLLEKQKVKEMSFLGKLEYIWMYYKPAIFSVIGVIILFCIGRNIYESSKYETVLSINVINGGMLDSDVLQEEAREILGTTDKYQTVEVGSNFTTGPNEAELDMYSQMAFVAKVESWALDVLILPEPLCEDLNKEGMLADMKELLGEELYESFGESACGNYLRFTDGKLNEKMDLYYDPVCVGVLANSRNMEYAKQWIASLAE